ncbi:hypothetical protein E2C01_063807 [Portunus trituberculatus]|uniref:Uncharacterized protein n=1 Tax=Portunus trituberculatus TaxID=210409 RepID=A0A5B7HLJ3_PORTR|nr:hypothetical protein [Portunus trituberculatus]
MREDEISHQHEKQADQCKVCFTLPRNTRGGCDSDHPHHRTCGGPSQAGQLDGSTRTTPAVPLAGGRGHDHHLPTKEKMN